MFLLKLSFSFIRSSWSSLVEEDNIPILKKIDCFVRKSLKFYFKKQPCLLLNGQASDSMIRSSVFT